MCQTLQDPAVLKAAASVSTENGGIKGWLGLSGPSRLKFCVKTIIFCYRTQAKLLNEDKKTGARVPDDQSSHSFYHLKYPEDS